MRWLRPATFLIKVLWMRRYELVCEYGYTFERLKTSIYYAGGFEDFPTAGDFVLIDYNPDGDSRIVKTLKGNLSFQGAIPRREGRTSSCRKL